MLVLPKKVALRWKEPMVFDFIRNAAFLLDVLAKIGTSRNESARYMQARNPLSLALDKTRETLNSLLT
ncbi:uncharacterized protein ALTATR162_LOCUS9959 [Alternaria atra]|uniref:Uncharacterized protein n=1 Tax=Alternaria atra TaxID=119953 RepID=A0A8J2N469_9PLEO|nr:uncharacterized protein ALTATR162_LOCUS9959 [Alternaria atra]CAG5182035.1 unnamed protein product [Alternaria atra]